MMAPLPFVVYISAVFFYSVACTLVCLVENGRNHQKRMQIQLDRMEAQQEQILNLASGRGTTVGCHGCHDGGKRA